MNEKFCILLQISLKFVPKGPVDSKPVLVGEMAGHPTGKKPLSEPVYWWMYATLGENELIHWIPNKIVHILHTTFLQGSKFCLIFVLHNWHLMINEVMVWCWLGNEPLAEPMMSLVTAQTILRPINNSLVTITMVCSNYISALRKVEVFTYKHYFSITCDG